MGGDWLAGHAGSRHNERMSVPILLSWSGGKDCLLTLETLRRDPRWRVVGLLTSVTRDFDRVAMHGIRREVLHAQARALGMPLVEMELDWPSSNEAYEQSMAGAFARAQRRWPGLRHCAYGDLKLEDVRAYRVRTLARHGWHAVFPLWGEDTAAVARRFVRDGHRARLVCVDACQLDPRCCGREFDAALLRGLPPAVDPCGENGEFHTLCYDGPLFARPLRLRRGESVLRDARFQYTDFLLDAEA